VLDGLGGAWVGEGDLHFSGIMMNVRNGVFTVPFYSASGPSYSGSLLPFLPIYPPKSLLPLSSQVGNQRLS
jgi:hypothetical protein